MREDLDGEDFHGLWKSFDQLRAEFLNASRAQILSQHLSRPLIDQDLGLKLTIHTFKSGSEVDSVPLSEI